MSLSCGLQFTQDGLDKFCLSDGQLVSTMSFSLLYHRLQSEYLTKSIRLKHFTGKITAKRLNEPIADYCFFIFRNPRLYENFQSARMFNVKVFWIWISNALIHSIILYWMPMYAYYGDVAWSSGRDGGYLVLGNMVYTV